MRVFALILGFMGVCLLAAAPQAAQAQATRTWISGVGDDANPCSRTAPCKTWPGAISKTAAGGEIDVLDPGGFGTVTIAKAITLDGNTGAIGSILASGVPGVTVNAGASDKIILRNMTINGISQTAGPGTIGVNFIAGQSLSLVNVNIMNFSGNCVSFQPATRATLAIDRSNFDNCAGGALIVVNGLAGGGVNRVDISNSVFKNSSYGITVGAASQVNIFNSVIAKGATGGVLANAQGAQVVIQNSMISDNTSFGLNATNGGGISIGGSSVINNTGVGVSNDALGSPPSATATWKNNYFAGNTGGDGTFTIQLTTK